MLEARLLARINHKQAQLDACGLYPLLPCVACKSS